MNTSCDSVERLSLGAYVLGALDPIERAAVDAHLSGCEACRDELAGLAAMPGLLSRVRVEDVLEGSATPARPTAERLIERLRAARRARRRRVAAAVGAAALAAVTAGAVVIATGDSGSGTEAAPISASNGSTGVSASFGLRPAGWGTAVHVRLRGVPPNTRCKLIAVSRDGRREVAATWRATYEGTADVEGATAIPRTRLASFEVATAAGRALVRASI
jgi:predicted anti-sigma-YlaC factor YlaD